MIPTLHQSIVPHLDRLARRGVEHGLPPAWFGYRFIRRTGVPAYCREQRGAARTCHYETVHPSALADNPLPRNIRRRDDLPADRGWWGYSFHDVPRRRSDETFIATLRDCRIAWYRDPQQDHDYYPSVVTSDGQALDLREIRFRPGHAQMLRQAQQFTTLDRATWFIERVYHNHSHWLTAHLPKLLLLRQRGLISQTLLPSTRSAAIDASLRLLGFEERQFLRYDETRPLLVRELTLVGTDRFRPELLRSVATAAGVTRRAEPGLRVFISRARAKRRRLVNEDELWALLEPAGFERVVMEDLDFSRQVELMKQTAVLCAPHGAGLTNMMFCPPGTQIVEIADLGFPNPNFYALASALGHDYWVVPAEALGDEHPLHKDLRVEVPAVRQVLAELGCT